MYKCSECSKQFSYPISLKKHLVTHRQSYHCNTCKRVYKCLDQIHQIRLKHRFNCTEIIPSFIISSVLHSTTTDFEALSIANSKSFVEDQVLPEITFEENQFENDNNDSHFENDNNDSQFESINSNNMQILCRNVSVNTSRN